MGDYQSADPGDFGRLVQARRRELGLSRNDIVDSSGLSYPYVAQLETGQRTPSRKSVARLADALRLSPDELGAAIPYDDERPSSRTARGARGSHWQTNPAYEARLPALAASAPPRRSSRRDPVGDVVALISQLPAEARLDALHEAQKRVVADLLEEQR